jgi:hypothetical protein
MFPEEKILMQDIEVLDYFLSVKVMINTEPVTE